MNSGVVYYSRSNNTRTAALYLAGINGAEIVEDSQIFYNQQPWLEIDVLLVRDCF